jgi:SAM-dependent methyltransferase
MGVSPTGGESITSTPFDLSARVYDLLYTAAGKDYGAEAEALHALVQSRRPGASSLLDVACGTGAHLAHLRRHYEVAGVDAAPAMLAAARERLPGVPLVAADMRSFRLGRRFDAVTCLFSAIGYMPTTADLARAVATMAGHLARGGVLIVDGWIRPDAWGGPGSVQMLCARDGPLAVARVITAHRDGRRTWLDMHHLVGSPDGVQHVSERHDLMLSTDAEYRDAFAAAGLAVDVVSSPHTDRDRYVGVAPG